ncbi:hypothetical protein SAVCW2_50310 [Streptomyces avermitilis]|nr:hypothetical protein SAVCW2_50310 [Streptomyces avermitilis]
MPGATAEQPGEQDALGDRCVLVLVEEHYAELVPQDGSDLRTRACQGRREGDLVTEVEEVALALGGPVAHHQVGQLTTGGCRFGDLAQLGVGELGALQ